MIAPPNKKQLYQLRLMILIGACCMVFFGYYLFKKEVRGVRPLYDLLIFTFIFTAAKILYEWYHYWSISINPPPPPGKKFTVDVFTTFCAGEPYEMIEETLKALKAVTYPHETYLCDEADDPRLKAFCRKLGVHHVTRTQKINAKAGNINNALKHSTGELCVVLDPDHVPFPDFLDPIVDHFNNPEIGYVQIVQAYSNQDQGWIAKGAAQQTYQYYGPMMMTMNAYGTAQAIGANCTFRRAALESIGGHAAGLAEDMHTSMQLHAKGWKSVYVPAVLSRGLVPATLSAYYKQQLKWSRGVFELLVTSYLKLFGKFTWRQKLHYGLVPMFYLSGFIYLLNFIIPAISLFADVYPLRMDFSVFAVISLPFITAVVLIRHYVQRWVMEDEERGFHIIGGLLLIGTWWVFIVGFFYTVIRKKVPYIPTPKSVEDEQNIWINLPNITVLAVSATAIIYGLLNDWNPYTFIMAGICAVNCLFMVFMLVASEQHKVRLYQQRHKNLSAMSSNIGAFKRQFWLLRRKLYSGVRSLSLILIVFSVCLAVYVGRPQSPYNAALPAIPDHKNQLLTGIYYPAGPGLGLTDLSRVAALQRLNKTHFNLVSLYLSWGDGAQNQVPGNLVDSIYRQHATPIITWEPWQNLFKGANGPDQYIFQRIIQGRYDNYISHIAGQLRQLNRPVFLRFAHEADNPYYPWSAAGKNTPDDFKLAWRHVHNVFLKHQAWNVIWVWNPWKPEAASAYFPGKQYVDWIGFTGLNYGRYGADTTNYSFRQLYLPFHRQPISQTGLPVMIAEMGTADDGKKNDKWLADGLRSIKYEFKEVKAVVLFNSAFDKNVPNHTAAQINWRQDTLNALRKLPASAPLNDNIVAPTTGADAKKGDISFVRNLRGVVYEKGQNWYGDQYAITRKTINADFAAMHNSGINTVKIYGPSVYDRITLNTAAKTKTAIYYSFWVADAPVIWRDTTYLPELTSQICKTVNNLKSNKNISCWNIGNNTLQQMKNYYLQPHLFYRQQAYINWLKQLVGEIKAADPDRKVTVDVAVGPDLNTVVTQLHDQVPEIDAFGLIWTSGLKDTAQIAQLTVPYYFSKVTPQLYFKWKGAQQGAIMENWQDQQTASGVTFNGLKDIWGRNKAAFYQVAHHWAGVDTGAHQLPRVKILRPSVATVPGDVLPFYALINKYNTWHLAQYLPNNLHFEWYQVQTDRWGTPLTIKLIKKGAYLDYRVPENPRRYRLYLVAGKGDDISTDYSILNIPLINAPEQEKE